MININELYKLNILIIHENALQQVISTYGVVPVNFDFGARTNVILPYAPVTK
jgi:hypothetical protein